MPSAASRLDGAAIDGGWTVERRIEQLPTQTGGFFSQGYLVRRKDGTPAFLKALDYSKALASDDPARDLRALTEAYIFERDILSRCGRMDRIVKALAAGSTRVDGEVVQYLIFELAEGDIRKYLDFSERFDVAWLLRSLHHIATGLMQLHGAGIAHQDVKPSNVLVFNNDTSKLSDLGRAASRETAAPHEESPIPGDHQYAPPELLYGYVHPEWVQRRLGCDAYHLGSMVVFLFGGVNMTAGLLSEVDPCHFPAVLRGEWTGTFEEVLPYLREAFNRSLADFEKDLSRMCPALRDELVPIVRQLCDPDPGLRGDPKERGRASQYALHRYVTRFNLLARKAEIGLLA